MALELLCVGHGQLELRSYALPDTLGPTQVRIRNRFGAEKHGTMQAFYKGHGNQRGGYEKERGIFVPGRVAWAYPIKLGNMQVGEVEAVGGGVTRYKAGDRVLHFSGFRPATVIDEKAGWPLPGDVSWKAAVCLDPLLFALAAVRDGQVRLGDHVAVFGLGAIGLMVVQALRIAGASQILAIDPVAERRALAERYGAHVALDPVGNDAGAMIRDHTASRGADVVIEYSGAMEAMQAALRGVAFGGTVVCGAFPGPMKAGLDLGAEAHHNIPTVVFSRGCSDPNRDHPRWNERRLETTGLELITAGRIDAEDIVTPVVPFGEELVDRYGQIATRPNELVKLGVRYA